MIQLSYAVFDEAAQAYLAPFFCYTDAMAKRAFKQSVNQKDHPFSKSPGDYTLFRICHYNDLNAELGGLTPIVSLGNGLEYRDPDLFDDSQGALYKQNAG